MTVIGLLERTRMEFVAEEPSRRRAYDIPKKYAPELLAKAQSHPIVARALLAYVVLNLCANASQAALDRPPNIVFLFADDLGPRFRAHRTQLLRCRQI